MTHLPELLDLAKNVAGLDEQSLLSMDIRTLRGTLREYRDDARAAIDKLKGPDVVMPQIVAALRAVKHGAEYTDELGEIIDAAIAKAIGCTYQDDFLVQEISNQRGPR